MQQTWRGVMKKIKNLVPTVKPVLSETYIFWNLVYNETHLYFSLLFKICILHIFFLFRLLVHRMSDKTYFAVHTYTTNPKSSLEWWKQQGLQMWFSSHLPCLWYHWLYPKTSVISTCIEGKIYNYDWRGDNEKTVKNLGFKLLL